MLTIIAPDMALLERDGKLMLLALPVAERWLKQVQLTPGENAACAQPLLIPVRLKILSRRVKRDCSVRRHGAAERRWGLKLCSNHNM